MKHRIRLGDAGLRRGQRSVMTWDDRSGRVTGGHTRLGLIREWLERPKPLRILHYAGTLVLRNPETDAADFKALLELLLSVPDAGIEYPASMRGVEPTEWVGKAGGCTEHERD